METESVSRSIASTGSIPTSDIQEDHALMDWNVGIEPRKFLRNLSRILATGSVPGPVL